MRVAYVMIGAPGAGKSTRAKEIALMTDAVIVCLDTLRGELWGDESIQGPWEELNQLYTQRVMEAAKSGRTVVIDATHARKRYRTQTIKMLRSYGYDRILCCLVHPSLEKCLTQNAIRLRRVPQRVIVQMWEAIDKDYTTIKKEFDN